MTDYRTAQATCPACGHLLDPRIAGDAEIDLCPKCHGIWVDWFDGDLVKVAHDAAPLPPAEPAYGGNAACPRCTRPLRREKLRGTAFVHRCGECAGTFVPRAAFDDLIGMTIEAPPKPEPTALDRLRAVLRFLVKGPTFEVPDD